MRPKRSEAKSRLAHGLAGFTVGLEGYEKIEAHKPLPGIILLLLGILLLLYARFHPRLHHSRFAPHLETALFVLEAIALATISGVFFEEGKHLLPWLYLVLVLIYLGLALRRHYVNRHLHGSQHA